MPSKQPPAGTNAMPATGLIYTLARFGRGLSHGEALLCVEEALRHSQRCASRPSRPDGDLPKAA